MKTIKPQSLGILTRCFEFRRRFTFVVSVISFVPLVNSDELYSEASMWKFVANELGKDAALEAGFPKARAEFLVTGSACIPGGEMRTGCLVRAGLGSCEKVLHVYGDRYWKADAPSEPIPFASMPLDWAHAFGGDGYDKNPAGKGAKAVDSDSGTSHWLPNILYPYERLISPDQQPAAAGFAPIDFAWPQRFSKTGTHDDLWLKEDFPGFARDMDWTIFNLASPDQWFSEPLQGDETFILENMHPSKPLIEGQLPGLKVRCFIDRVTEQGLNFEEIITRLSTVWFFPHAERAVLIYQGSCEVTDEDAADIAHLITGAERLTEEKTANHYREVLAMRLDEEKGYLCALRDSELMPKGMAVTDPSLQAFSDLMKSEDLLRKNLRNKAVAEAEKARAIVASYGLDPDVHGPKVPPPDEPLPSLETLPEYLDKVTAEAELQKKKDEERMAETLRDLEKLFDELGLDVGVVKQEISEKPKGPPSFSAQAHINGLSELAQRLNAQGIATDEIEQYLADEEFCNRLRQGEEKLKEAYRSVAHYQDPAPSLSADAAQSTKEAISAAFSKGDGFAGSDLTGADLSGMDLHGADFTDAFLESVNFRGANLAGCNFQRAVLAHSCLQAAILTGVNLEEANLGSAQLNGADLRGANLCGAILTKADLTEATFKEARLENADCSGAVLNETDFSCVIAQQLNFLESDLRGLRLTGAQIDKTNFIKVDVSGVDFSGASLKSAAFVEVQGKGASFSGADITNACFVQRCNFESATFSDAALNRANLRGSCLNGCDFSGAQLDGADLSECQLRGANFYRAVAREARFMKADLSEAVMTSMNAMNASFNRADIRGADLREANLFQADLARVRADNLTNLAEALTARVRVYPRRVS